MLPDWMILEIQKQEQAKQEQERPRMEIPVPPQDWRPYPEDKKEESNRGVIVIEPPWEN